MHELSGQLARWDRRPGEPPRAFTTFCTYRDLHPLGRSLAEVGRKLGISKTYLERLSVKFQWVERPAAFDRQGGRAEDVDAIIRLADEAAAKGLPVGPLTNKSVPEHRLVGV